MSGLRETIRWAAARFDAVHGRGAAERELRLMIILIPVALIAFATIAAITGDA
jgi:hypothetical protein